MRLHCYVSRRAAKSAEALPDLGRNKQQNPGSSTPRSQPDETPNRECVENLNPTRVRLTVEVPFEELKDSLDAAYKKINQQVTG